VIPAASPEDVRAEQLRGFGLLGVLAIVVVLTGNLLFAPLSAILVLLWAWASRTPWREIGFVRPRSWIASIVLGVVFGSAFKLVMKALVMPLFGAPAINPTYHYLAGNRAALPGAILAMTVVAGFGEETVFRGYLFERLGRLFGTGHGAKAAIVLLTAALFAMAHYHDQGMPGVEQATITGLVFGGIFAITGRLWTVIFAHAAFDLTALALIYWDVEAAVAHLVFR
jgi:membrane protease YdiL (CAAX protease family)